MARAPRPGACKTRLEPLLGSHGCAALQAQLIRHTAGWAQASGRPVWVALDPPDAEAQLTGLVPASVALLAQQGRDLGERLAHAVAHVAAAHTGPLTVLGTDSPTLGARDIDTLELALEGGWDASLIGAYDGGYAAIALARPVPGAFALPSQLWSGPHVLTGTLARLRREGLSAAVLDVVHDLDTPADAARLRQSASCPPTIRPLLTPATRAGGVRQMIRPSHPQRSGMLHV
jgi:rSAM/selenodomain-associated transferase 1